MDEPSLEQRVNEMDGDVTDAMVRAVNAYWPSTALACALLDRGVIEKVDLLKIIDSLIVSASSYAVMAEADPDAAVAGLERFRRDLEELTLKPGHVLDELRELEQQSGLEAFRYREAQRRNRPSDEDPEGASS